MNLINPFSDFGKIVTGDRFIGRSKEISIIQNRILGSNFGNLAIMGLPRIGKSSLAWNAIYIRKNELEKDKVLVFWIRTGEISSSKNFFLKLSYELFKHLENIDINVFNELNKYYKKILDPELYEIEFTSYLQRFFKKIRQEGFKIIYVLDEFDNCQRIFKVEDFQILRDLSYNPDSQIALLTISRRTLQEIEPENGALSNFYQIFTDINLGFYNEPDYLTYWNYVKKHNIKFNNEAIDLIQYYTARHPYLLDLINNDIFNNLESHSINFVETFNSIVDNLRLKILNEYNTILKLMKEENLDSKAIQILVGPVYDVKQVDIEKLIKYQLVKVENNKYEGFCPYFYEYLRISQSEYDFWPLWSETEKELRGIVKIFLNERFGEDWIDKFKKANIKKTSTIDDLTKLYEKSKKSFGDKASLHLVDYTYPADIVDCFFHSDWPWFKKIFGKEFKDWKPKFDHLNKIRNPVAHNNQQFLTEADKNNAIGYCQEIKTLIDNWKKNRTDE